MEDKLNLRKFEILTKNQTCDFWNFFIKKCVQDIMERNVYTDLIVVLCILVLKIVINMLNNSTVFSTHISFSSEAKGS